MSIYLYLKGDKVMDLRATPKSVEDALQLKRKYIIPRFQREYSWEPEELSEFYEDLLDNIVLDEFGKLQPTEYFIGSLVLVGDDDDSTKIERYVVDGQQRLTTITIIFSVLAQKFKECNEDKLSAITHGYIVGEDNDGIAYSKLINESPKPFFQERIQKKDIDFTIVPKTQEEKRILAAYNFFERQLRENILIKELRDRNPLLENYEYTDLLKVFRDQILKCKVVYVTVKTLEDAYTIFEVLNAKGKNLEPIDLIKNTIFSILTDVAPADSAYEKWKEIKSNITTIENVEFSTFYRHYWLSRYCLSTNKKLVANFERLVHKDKESYGAFLNTLLSDAKLYHQLVRVTTEDWKQPEELSTFTSLQAFNIFNVTQVRIFLLALFDSKKRGSITHKNYKKILTFLEHYHFIFTAVCSSRPSGLERRYSSYARALRGAKSKEESAKCISNLMTDLQESLPAYSSFETKFLTLKFTSDDDKNKKLIQYVLKKIEKYYAGDELKPNSFTIEHILPESTHAPFVGMIGNLLPLGAKLNEELDDKSFDIKISRYPQSRYVTVKEFEKKYKDLKVWNEDNIMERTKELAKILYENVIEG